MGPPQKLHRLSVPHHGVTDVDAAVDQCTACLGLWSVLVSGSNVLGLQAPTALLDHICTWWVVCQQAWSSRWETGRHTACKVGHWALHIAVLIRFACLFVGCLTSQQYASVSQGRICLDNFTFCHTEIEVADPTFYLTQSQYTDTGPTSPSADPITPGAWQGSHWSAKF